MENSPKIYKRQPSHRVFVNRNLRLEKIKFFGFDMDYTLAAYKSPEFELLTFDFIIQRMISIGYPEDLRKFNYDPIFPVRGLWFDYLYGNLLKVDGFGNILMGIHGFHFMKPSEIEEMYPNKFLHLTNSRTYVLNTLFHLPETYLVACLINYFDNCDQYERSADNTGVKSGEVFMSYQSIFQDLRTAVDWVHFGSEMKKVVLQNIEKYVVKDDRIKQLLSQIQESGKQTFLLTNSDYTYTNGLMKYLIGNNWTSYFNIAVVDARKPKWFAEGTVFREVNKDTGALKIGIHTGSLKQGQVYSGGSCEAFRRLVKARGKDVLYVGDHIFGDVLKSKKTRGWRTFLVIPELIHELTVWTERRPLFEQLNRLDTELAHMCRNLDSHTKERPAIASILQSIRVLTNEMDSEYGMLGSLFRSGSRTTFFASQVERYADLYSSSCFNLTHYPLFYFFRAPMTLMPHESTVDHASMMEPHMYQNRFSRRDSVGQQVRGIRKTTTFCHEEEEEEDLTSSSDTDTDRKRRERSSSDDNSKWFDKPSNSSDIVAVDEAHVDLNGSSN